MYDAYASLGSSSRAGRPSTRNTRGRPLHTSEPRGVLKAALWLFVGSKETGPLALRNRKGRRRAGIAAFSDRVICALDPRLRVATAKAPTHTPGPALTNAAVPSLLAVSTKTRMSGTRVRRSGQEQRVEAGVSNMHGIRDHDV